MNIIISNSSAVPLYEQIQNQIKSQILSGDLNSEELLPSIRSLAKELKVSIITTKRAYEELEKEGYIQTVAGKGSYVCSQSTERLKEAAIFEMESKLEEIILSAKKMGINEKDFMEIIKSIYEEV
ncbi:GntR family transcriptional regulator [Terrisporobacter glycolicus]|uniref:HTH-type transcriptional repressor YtrA n=1 Tax=Terrisporobacter glycolicus ATCC 14880 = DSM 1288 TaxID=1121315 RepID=A0ABZ2EX41_9FIRM|nr:GntR family transcriptional regulator [Terrisporobacter glycolicus]